MIIFFFVLAYNNYTFSLDNSVDRWQKFGFFRRYTAYWVTIFSPYDGTFLVSILFKVPLFSVDMDCLIVGCFTCI